MKLGDISPVAGVMTGEGLMGKLASAGGMGLLPAAIARDAQKEEEEKRKKQAADDAAPTAAMKKGGMTSSASKRADGIAQRGKTRGKMC
jgi:hypothetical protein